jgi:ketosteroid isomerase-like protein
MPEGMTDRDTVADWMRRYVQAWGSNDPGDIRGLFTEDAEYRFSPWDDPERGHDEIVRAWVEAADEPDDHRFEWETIAVDGPVAVVQGRTDYVEGNRYQNLWVLRLADDGRAESFTEWFMPPSEE